MRISGIPIASRKEVDVGKLKTALYFLPACGLGLVVVFTAFFAGEMLSVFIAPPSGRSTDKVLRDGAVIGLILYLATVWALQHRLIRAAPMFLRAAFFFALPGALAILYGQAHYIETGIALAVIAGFPLCPLLVRFSESERR